MRATLCERFLPPQMQPADLQAAHEHRKTNPDVVAAWDLEMKGWRSFRLDTVTYLQGVHTE
jgi:predicted DNA-binding transcriptional regulator YafY